MYIWKISRCFWWQHPKEFEDAWWAVIFQEWCWWCCCWPKWWASDRFESWCRLVRCELFFLCLSDSFPGFHIFRVKSRPCTPLAPCHLMLPIYPHTCGKLTLFWSAFLRIDLTMADTEHLTYCSAVSCWVQRSRILINASDFYAFSLMSYYVCGRMESLWRHLHLPKAA